MESSPIASASRAISRISEYRRALPRLRSSARGITIPISIFCLRPQGPGLPPCGVLSLDALHVGEEYHVADGILVGEEHDKAVDANAHAACGGHSHHKGGNVV